MPLTKSERDVLNRIEQNSKEFAAAQVKINETLGQLLQEIYGPPPERNNGLRGDMKSLKDFREKHELAEAKRTGFIAAISSVVTLVGIAGREIIKAVFGH
jgi:hypothetical protein